MASLKKAQFNNIAPKSINKINCAKHGEQEDYGHGCTRCLVDAQRIADEAKEREEFEAVKNKVMKERINASLASSAIPPRFINSTFKNFDTPTKSHEVVRQIARSYATEFSGQAGNKIFYGGTGAGKTHLACAVANIIINYYDKTAFFTSVTKLDQMIKDTWKASVAKTATEVLESLLLPDLLIIDEVGIQTGSAQETSTLHEVVGGRYEHCKATLLISNLDLEGVEKALGGRLFSRMNENGNALHFDLQDWRMKK